MWDLVWKASTKSIKCENSLKNSLNDLWKKRRRYFVYFQLKMELTCFKFRSGFKLRRIL